MTITEKIKKLAHDKGMSIPNLEIELGLGNGTISRWRTANPSLDKLLKVAKYFHVSLDYLSGRGDSYLPHVQKQDSNDVAFDLKSLINKLEETEVYYEGVIISPDDAELLNSQLKLMVKRLER